MHWKKYKLRFNSVEYVDLLVDAHTADEKDINNILEKYKLEDEYKDDSWDEDTILDYLTESGIVLIPLNINVDHEFYLPDGNNREEENEND